MIKKRKRKPTKVTLKKRLLIIGFYFAVCFLLFFLLLTGITLLGTFGSVPNKAELGKIKNHTASEIYTADNYLLGRYYYENRTNIPLSSVPKHVINALIATEDARFYSHNGIDNRSMLRVLFKSVLLMNKGSGGGSTITQQLAKNLYPRKNIGFITIPVAKIREIAIALRLEKVYSKDEILELYLNTVPFGSNTYGIETAALVFFNKKPSQLGTGEAAVLVGMLKGNTDFNPVKNYDASLERRNVVIDQMVRYNYISDEKAKWIKGLPIELDYHKMQHDEGPAPYFREYLRQQLKSLMKGIKAPDGTDYNIYTDGLKIYTTIDYNLQVEAENVLKTHLRQLQKQFNEHWKGKEPWEKNPLLARQQLKQCKRYQALKKQGLDNDAILTELSKPVQTKIFTHNGEKEVSVSPLDSILHHFALLQGGLLSVESSTGFVKAWVGGIDYRYFKYDHVTAHRQAGSTFKPIVYAAALEAGAKPCDFYPNDSIVYAQYDNWTPRNADRKYGGYYSLQGALTHSVNTVSAHLIMETGIDKTIALAEEMGLNGDLPEVPSLALGTGTVSVLELVEAYSVFVNKGIKIQPMFIRRIEDQDGNVIYTQNIQQSAEPVLAEQTATTITAMLRNVVDKGTASSLRSVYGFTSDMAGKTGTTQNHTDGWFVGFTPDLITAVWVGGDSPVVRFRSLTYGQGSYMALPIYARYMQQFYSHPVYKESNESSFNIPEDILANLDCPEYKEQEIETLKDILDKTEESINEFIRRIFKKRKR